MKNKASKVFATIITAIVLTATLFSISPVLAAPDPNSGGGNANASNTTGSVFTGTCRYFLGLVSWDCYVDVNDESTLKEGIWTIVANVATDITVIAAYLVLCYVIYGGYRYTFSNGDPGKIAAGKKTLTQAFIGLAIVMSANVILNAIRIALGANFTKICIAEECSVAPNIMIVNAIQWVVGIAGVVSVIFVVYGGISYTTSSGDPSKVQKAKQIILYALIGLVIVGLAEVITAFVSSTIRNANSNSYLNNTTIAKELYEKN